MSDNVSRIGDGVFRATIGTHEEQEEAKALARQYKYSSPGQVQPEPRSFVASGKFVGNSQSVVVGTGQHTIPAPAVFHTGDLAPRDESQGIMSTARSMNGNPQSGRSVTPKTLVLVQGMETSVAAAVAMGLVRTNPATGYYEDANTPSAPQTHQERLQAEYQQALDKQNAEAAEKAKAAEAVANEQITPFDEQLESHIADFQKIGNMDLKVGMDSIINGGELTEDIANRAATLIGVTPDEVRERAAGLHAAFTKQAMDMTGAGEGLSVILETMNKINPTLVNKAIRAHVEEGKRNAYDEVINQYIYDLPKHDPQGFLAHPAAQALGARMEKRGGGDPVITIEVPGVGRVEWRAAIRANLISPQFPKGR